MAAGKELDSASFGAWNLNDAPAGFCGHATLDAASAQTGSSRAGNLQSHASAFVDGADSRGYGMASFKETSTIVTPTTAARPLSATAFTRCEQHSLSGGCN